MPFKYPFLVSKVYGENNIQILVDIIKKDVPIIYGLDASILLIADSGSLYNMTGATNSEGIKYTHYSIHYSINSGLTGKSISKKQILFIENPIIEPKFDSHIDNIYEISNIRNIVLIPLFDQLSEPIGVIQLLNNMYGFDEFFKVQLKRKALKSFNQLWKKQSNLVKHSTIF